MFKHRVIVIDFELNSRLKIRRFTTALDFLVAHTAFYLCNISKISFKYMAVVKFLSISKGSIYRQIGKRHSYNLNSNKCLFFQNACK